MKIQRKIKLFGTLNRSTGHTLYFHVFSLISHFRSINRDVAFVVHNHVGIVYIIVGIVAVVMCKKEYEETSYSYVDGVVL